MKARDVLPLDRIEEIARNSKMLSLYDSGEHKEWIAFSRAVEDIVDELETLKKDLAAASDESDFAAIAVSIQHIFWHIYDSRYFREVIDEVVTNYGEYNNAGK
ncbi:MAG TPA: hypothetical protein PKW21_12600 [Rhabdaerophilum sp.]|nr:hypothetical protein [Rhabdaerophilum sp.]